MQPQETFTIKELSELFKISRQAISKHIQKLDSSMIAKNERGYKIVLRSGVLQLAHNLGNQRLLDKLHEHEQNSDKNAYIPTKNVVANELLDQQQQLTLQANQQIEKLQEQLQLTYTEKTLENESTTVTEEIINDTPPPIEKKWWKLWK